ncbi:glutathione S-transferase Mu 4-like [Bufo gargarizans]|uniref:glutathione S-transferase Mu 4-like n=1 Tax=Bufo gargarizans TaxID=30331 RepID=UPI001CF4F924|nr:glutathione S-transferase Mu 4-like [Bufo gargarizans]XP_044143262.1 glutathione S-transferase Mu 4-like [Bufo gargarizans]
MMILGYWDIRGLAHAIRLLLEYTGTPYEEKHYVEGDAPDYDKSQWLDEKEKLGLDFPNLPYLLDGDVKLTQSNTILRYIAGKHGLCGNTEKEKIIVSLIENEVVDFHMRLFYIAYSPDFEQLKGPYLENLPTVLERYSRFLGERHWFAGDKITFADFLMYDVLDKHIMLDPTCLQKFNNLQEFHSRFEALPAIAAYMKTPRFIKTRINNRMAFWANT